ncbi:hypothetical protein [Paraburkholderia tagetis]|uniref:Uncharacterized protein n=1 Tax=Paraburkholderia tagetis TaxID=2913261 RepID=A0A9X1UGV6_9BURK|nr:hypothetical protein [Paraburkholderia tagetis]MCG5073042.1 hypothetical protein [Paraburkholderia tagetis]
MKTTRKPSPAATVTPPPAPTITPPPAPKRGPANTASVLTFFWSQCDASAMSAGDLEWLGNASLHVQTMASGLSAALSGFGNLLSANPNGAEEIGARTMEQVLWRAADTLDTIAALEFIASEAEFELRSRIARRPHSHLQDVEHSSQGASHA